MALTKRASGVLMPIFSLPGPYGIGSFGKEARLFIDQLKRMGFSYWQILPLGPIDDYYSPYKSDSAFAGNPLFIDLPILYEWDLLTHQELKDSQDLAFPYLVSYSSVIKNRFDLFKKAYSRLKPPLLAKIELFKEEESHWLMDYALYKILVKHFNESNWAKWPDQSLSFHDPTALKKIKDHYSEAINFEIFLQYAFLEQWLSLKAYANEKGIEFIGDMPIYLSYENADVWANPQYFQLDDNRSPINVAGVPADYFSKNGQLWGNPLYNWETLKKDNYSWWNKRLEKGLECYDLLRIDHFRAFSAYWSIPADSKSALNGQWVKGPGIDFFKQFATDHDTSAIIAEDLGVQDTDLENLLAQTNFPGMRLMSFAFIDNLNNLHLPHNYRPNCIAYTGTHDNNTLLGSLFEYSPDQRSYALDYCQYQEDQANDWQIGGAYSPACRSIIKTLWKSPANLVILPIQDLCGYGGDTIINKPGTIENNWEFRMTKEGLLTIDEEWYKHINTLYHRNANHY